MIRLNRPPIPVALNHRAANETHLLWQAWNAGLPLEIKSSVYAHAQVKQALRDGQHHKCAYCETKNPRSHDVVEHYRPKLGWRQLREMPLQVPQYFWLAYSWENLLFACDLCNDGGHKQNLFPLYNPRSRATPANPDTTVERPLLINPYLENPSRFIIWNADVPTAKDSNRKGLLTIETFGLAKDQDLIDARRGHFNLIQAALQTAEGLTPNDPRRLRTREVLMACLEDAAQYAAMVRSSFQTRIEAL